MSSGPPGGHHAAAGHNAGMSVVKINAIEVPEGMGPELERRFARRAAAVDQAPGFEGFELLRPVEGETRYFVYTRWSSEEAFEAWRSGADFGRGHAEGTGSPHGPVATGSALLSFEVVDLGSVDAG